MYTDELYKLFSFGMSVNNSIAKVFKVLRSCKNLLMHFLRSRKQYHFYLYISMNENYTLISCFNMVLQITFTLHCILFSKFIKMLSFSCYMIHFKINDALVFTFTLLYTQLLVNERNKIKKRLCSKVKKRNESYFK